MHHRLGYLPIVRELLFLVAAVVDVAACLAALVARPRAPRHHHAGPSAELDLRLQPAVARGRLRAWRRACVSPRVSRDVEPLRRRGCWRRVSLLVRALPLCGRRLVCWCHVFTSYARFAYWRSCSSSSSSSPPSPLGSRYPRRLDIQPVPATLDMGLDASSDSADSYGAAMYATDRGLRGLGESRALLLRGL